MWALIVSTSPATLSREVQDWQTSRSGESRWMSDGRCTAFVEPTDDAVVLDTGTLLIVGRARLDSEPLGPRPQSAAAALAAAARNGQAGFDALVGEFGFVVWDRSTGVLRAVRDHAGIRPLYYAQSGDALRVSDDPNLIRGSARVDEEFVASFIASRGSCAHRSVWTGVTPVPAASTLAWADGRQRVEPYWNPAIPEVAARPCDLPAAADEFRRLLSAALASSVRPGGGTWAHLSGGLDSSSVVAAAAHDALHGTGHPLGGTITFVDSDRSGDETAYSRTVVDQYALRNVIVDDEWPWRDDGEPAPAFDEPTRDLPFYARDRRVANVLRAHSASTLLSGVGPDHLLPVTPAHIPDLVWHGDLREASDELYRWSACRGESMWKGVARHVLLPLATRRLQPWWRQAGTDITGWFTQQFLTNQELSRRIVEEQTVPGGARGALYDAATRHALGRIGVNLWTWCASPGIEVRHPYLHQPLLKFCATLPYRLRTDIYQPKPVLRAAMRSILPEHIRQRRSKGGQLEPRICRAFVRERPYLERLLKTSVLADYGVIEPSRALAAIDRAASGMLGAVGYLYSMLSLEMWLSMRSGR